MANIRPFQALRPKPGLASQICELPYDVVSSAEARQQAAGNPLSFFHVSKPEIDLPPSTDPHDPCVYAKGDKNLERLIVSGALRQDAQSCFYLYQQVMGNYRQTGFVAVASCADYQNNIIKRHELTRPEQENDRARHIVSLNAQTGPAFLIYRAQPGLTEFIAARSAEPPEIDFIAKDGVRHSAWIIGEPSQIKHVQDAFAQMPCLYIADGHHRTAAAAGISVARQGAGNSGYFLSVIFPHDQLRILPYNRLLKDLNGLTPSQLLEKLAAVFTVTPKGASVPYSKHTVSLLVDRQWFGLAFRSELVASANLVETLDASLLQRHVLAPIFGISNPRTSDRLQFIGGVHSIAKLEKLVNSGQFACAFSLFPTSVEDLMSITDAGGIMPPKSTWFEPKLRDGMFCHLI